MAADGGCECGDSGDFGGWHRRCKLESAGEEITGCDATEEVPIRPHATQTPSRTIASVVFVLLLVVPAIEAQELPEPESSTPQLSPSFPDCEGTWTEQLDSLEPRQRSWARGVSHRVYDVRVDERVIARLELMSLASPEACNVSEQWVLRHNTVLVTYFPDDGGAEEVQYDFEPDHDFFAQWLEVEAGRGMVRIVGTNFDGDPLMMELELERLEALYDEVAGDSEDQGPRLTA